MILRVVASDIDLDMSKNDRIAPEDGLTIQKIFLDRVAHRKPMASDSVF